MAEFRDYPERNTEMPQKMDDIDRKRQRLSGVQLELLGPGAEQQQARLRTMSLDQVREVMRETRQGEVLDTRPKITMGGPSSDSADSPPEVKDDQPELPMFEADEFYQVQLSKPVAYAGRTLAPGAAHLIKGSTANQFKDSIHGAKKSE